MYIILYILYYIFNSEMSKEKALTVTKKILH